MATSNAQTKMKYPPRILKSKKNINISITNLTVKKRKTVKLKLKAKKKKNLKMIKKEIKATFLFNLDCFWPYLCISLKLYHSKK